MQLTPARGVPSWNGIVTRTSFARKQKQLDSTCCGQDMREMKPSALIRTYFSSYFLRLRNPLSKVEDAGAYFSQISKSNPITLTAMSYTFFFEDELYIFLLSRFDLFGKHSIKIKKFSWQISCWSLHNFIIYIHVN